MVHRLAAIVVLALVLVGAVFYSQIRVELPKVSGIIEADEIRLGSRVGGRIESVNVREGDQVKVGQALVRLEPYDINEREKVAISELAAREAELAKLQTGLRPEEIAQAESRFQQLQAALRLLQAGPRVQEIEAAKSRLEAANALLVLSNQDESRIRQLFGNNAVSKAELDRAIESFRVATAEVSIRSNELAILEAGSRSEDIERATAQAEEARLAWEIAKQGSRQEDINAAIAAKDAAHASLQAIRRQQDELTITSPSDGTIDALEIQRGDLIAPNAPVLALLSTKQLWIRAYVPQRYLLLQVGDRLPVTVDSLPGQSFFAEVTYISRRGEFTPSNVQTSDERAKQVYRIRLAVDDADSQLRPGMTADVWLNQPADNP